MFKDWFIKLRIYELFYKYILMNGLFIWMKKVYVGIKFLYLEDVS